MEQTAQGQVADTRSFLCPTMDRLTRLAELPSSRAIATARDLLSAVDAQFGHSVRANAFARTLWRR